MLDDLSGRAPAGTFGVEVNDLWASMLGHGLIAFGAIEHGVALAIGKIDPKCCSNTFLGKPLSVRIDRILATMDVMGSPHLARLAEALEEVKPLLPLRNHIAHNPVMLDFWINGSDILTTQSVASLKSGGVVLTYTEASEFVGKAKAASLALYDALAALP